MGCSYADINAKKWDKCPKCGNRNKDFFVEIKPEDFVSTEVSYGEENIT